MRNGHREMAGSDGYKFIGKGLYSVPEAARLTNVPSARIRRWLSGYRRAGGDLARPAILAR